MTLKPRDKIVLGAVLVLVALVGAYKFVLSPERHKATDLGTQIAAQQQALVGAQTQLTAGRAAQASLRTQASDWAALRRAVPNTSDIPALLRVLERNARAVGVSMQAIQLSGASSSPAASAAPSPSTTPSTGAEAGAAAASVPLSLTFDGGYTALNKLVRRLDGLVVVSHEHVHASGPLLSISNVSLSGAPKLTVQLTANIYQLAGQSTATDTTGGSSS